VLVVFQRVWREILQLAGWQGLNARRGGLSEIQVTTEQRIQRGLPAVGVVTNLHHNPWSVTTPTIGSSSCSVVSL
jgi:hypothetical protein